MINLERARLYCKDDISKIENYDKAVADTSQTWVIHHKLELTLNGEHARYADELMTLNMYFGRPYYELIFLQNGEHKSLHNKAIIAGSKLESWLSVRVKKNNAFHTYKKQYLLQQQ